MSTSRDVYLKTKLINFTTVQELKKIKAMIGRVSILVRLLRCVCIVVTGSG